MMDDVSFSKAQLLTMKNCLMPIAFVLAFMINVPSLVHAQEGYTILKATKAKTTKKGSLYVYWGWNREWYADTKLHFVGNGYDFNLKNVAATDRQSPFRAKTYLNPSNATIPQYNFRLGYFITDKYNISLGIDHMKYVVTQNQVVNIDGNISDTNSGYDGQYSGENIKIGEDFLKFEHTDGLNFINIDLRRFHELWTSEKVTFNVLGGLGAGILLPRTDATLLGKPRHDQFHLSGYGISGVAGVNVALWKYFFIQSEYKLGYISLPDILTTYETADRADQKIFFSQFNVVFGGNIYL